MRILFMLAALLAAIPAVAAEHAVEIKGMKFNPAALSVAVGDSITFTNGDAAPHTATALDASFDTGRLTRARARLSQCPPPASTPSSAKSTR